MKLGIMQPYFFPYIGYFQLINAVDKFVIYDDVNFIKQGWINRNNILVQGKPLFFTVPLKNQSSFVKIDQVMLNDKIFESWRIKFLRTLEQSYKKTPYFSAVFSLVNNVLSADFNEISISALAVSSIKTVVSYLDINTEIVETSAIYNNSHLSGKERVADICRIEKAAHYINPIGGQELYNIEFFKAHGLELSFIKSLPVDYKQLNEVFVPWLSIIDILMNNSVEEARLFLTKYELI